MKVRGIGVEELHVLGQAELNFRLGNDNFVHSFVVVGMANTCILGADVLKDSKMMVDIGNSKLSWPSPWSSPIVLAPKKDGNYRFWVDFRRVNSVTKKDAQPMPCIDDILDQLGGAKYFSTLDLASGYWQVPLREEDREKSIFGAFWFAQCPCNLSAYDVWCSPGSERLFSILR